jgi:hypothetical protein
MFNDEATVSTTRVGRTAYAVTRIDNVLLDPQAITALALGQTYHQDPGNFYPGMRAVVPESFAGAFRVWLARKVPREFSRDTTYFSVVTTASADLLPIQRIPHYDSTNPALFAAVLYLCDSRFSGTSFYRHRRTGYEEITEENRKNYQLALDNDLRLHGPPKREYVNGDTPLFERIFSNPLAYNSAIVYPCRALHAGDIPAELTPPSSKNDWRLTVTSLLVSDISSEKGPGATALP